MLIYNLRSSSCERHRTVRLLIGACRDAQRAHRELRRSVIRSTGVLRKQVMVEMRLQDQSWFRPAMRITGAGLLFATGAIHLDLYVTGYRTVPTIGWLFLLQVIAAFAIGVIVLATGSRLVAAAGAGFALSTLVGYLLSLRLGLFGFREVRTEIGIVAGVIEIAAFAVLATLALAGDRPPDARASTSAGNRMMDRLRANAPHLEWAVLGCSALAAVLLGVSSAATGP